MELVEGKSLHTLSERIGLPAESVLRYGVQIASALARAHDKGIVHRDLKSANIVITSEGLVKVLDFGLAKRIGSGV
jgi:serine/threonine protein kinase